MHCSVSELCVPSFHQQVQKHLTELNNTVFVLQVKQGQEDLSVCLRPSDIASDYFTFVPADHKSISVPA